MLYKFLLAEREGILALCASKLLVVGDARSSSHEMEVGLPVFYDELIEVLRADEEESTEEVAHLLLNVHRASAIRRGKESFKLGYTISQVVHGYGALCQAVTEYASQYSDIPIGSHEFNRLNFCLDVAIAEAVTEYNRGKHEAIVREEALRLGFLAHEMRNALANVSMAHQMIKKGVVGIGGSTNMVLEESLRRMKDIIDRSLAEVRLQGEPVIDFKRCRIIDMLGEVESTAMFEANDKSIQLHVEVLPDLVVMGDRHLVVSAISNLVQNAIKFTRVNGNVWIRGKTVEGRILIEVEDECGGLPPGKIEDLFRPFTQKGTDKTGVGLGLSISSRAIALNNGEISAMDIPGKGCIFTINLPGIPALPGEAEGTSVPIH